MFRIIFIYTCFIVRDVYTCKALFQTSKQPNAPCEVSARSSFNGPGRDRKRANKLAQRIKPSSEAASKIAVEATLSHASTFLGSRRILYRHTKRKRPRGAE